MRSLAHRVLSHIRRQELLRAGERVGVAVSGGIDSVALLRLMLELRGELGIVPSVVHFNHKLRGSDSDADQEFVAALARAHDLEFFSDGDDVARHAADDHISVEAAARELRYGFFRWLLTEDQSNKEDPSRKKDQLKSPLLAARNAARNGAPDHGVNLSTILTAHTLDDQAETVLMHMIRGTGLRGLGGIHPRIAVEDDDGEICGEIVRPLLTTRRCELEQYLRDLGQPWREDSTNSDTALTRNRIRKLVVPLLEKEFNPSVAENLAELAEIARGEEDYWDNEVTGWMGTAVHWSEPEWARAARSRAGLVRIETSPRNDPQRLKLPHPTGVSGAAGAVPFPVRAPAGSVAAQNETLHDDNDSLQSRMDNAHWLVMNASVDRLWFLGEPAAVQRRLVKAIGEEAGIPLAFRHIEEILRFAEEQNASGKELSLPLGWRITKAPNELIFVTPDLREPAVPQDYEYELVIPGQTAIAEAGTTFEARRIPGAAAAGYNPDHLLDAESLPGTVTVRNWRPGDRFWPAHSKSPKKIKELLQERHVAQAERRLWPVVVTRQASGEEIVWVRGFPPSSRFRARTGQDAILIAETPVPVNPVT